MTRYQQAASKWPDRGPRRLPHRARLRRDTAVGQVIIRRSKIEICAEVTLWMAAGKIRVEVVGGGKSTLVVRPGATALASECVDEDAHA